MERDIKFLHAFNTIRGVGLATLQTLKTHFGSFEDAWGADERALADSGIKDAALVAMGQRASIHPDREMERLIRSGIWCITQENQAYPERLKEIPRPPIILYGRGSLPDCARAIAVVGTRKPSLYGLETTEIIVRGLARAGVVIVSGLALGIDGRAHHAALEEKGKTVGVIGSGVDRESVYPQEHLTLAQKIAESGGALLSEYPPGTPAFREHFPQRNRIISGLSLGTLVVEARERSGALITARLALEQNRDVFAVPGSIFSLSSSGPHALIREGAKLTQTAEDILEELGIEYTQDIRDNAEDSDVDDTEKIILALLEEPFGVDRIKEKTGIDTATIMASLSMLELKGKIRSLGQDTYQKTERSSHPYGTETCYR